MQVIINHMKCKKYPVTCNTRMRKIYKKMSKLECKGMAELFRSCLCIPTKGINSNIVQTMNYTQNTYEINEQHTMKNRRLTKLAWSCLCIPLGNQVRHCSNNDDKY